MEQIRKPFQGVWNIIMFNWHLYLWAFVFFTGLLILKRYISEDYDFYVSALIVLVLTIIFISLFVSFYIYDVSNLYKLDWLEDNNESIKIVNINAGFDETSGLLKAKFKNAELIILDFYNPEKHSEISIKRARNFYPSPPNAKQITTSNLVEKNNSIDKIFVTLSAHEIRDENERLIFFKELHRILKPDGQIFITEHLRDAANFFAYNIGFFHFHSKESWHKSFEFSNLTVKAEKKITPFITIFRLEKNGVTS